VVPGKQTALPLLQCVPRTWQPAGKPGTRGCPRAQPGTTRVAGRVVQHLWRGQQL